MENLAKGNWTDPERVQHFADTYSKRYGDQFWIIVKELLGDKSRESIADFGCGPGVWLSDAGTRFESKQLHALDASSEMLQFASEILSSEFGQDMFQTHLVDFDLADIPLPPDSLDLGFSGYFLHEIADPLSFTNQIYTTLSDEGICLVFDFVSGHPEEFVKALTEMGMDEERARKRYPSMCKHSLDDIERILKESGFKQITSKKLDDFRAIVVGLKRAES